MEDAALFRKMPLVDGFISYRIVVVDDTDYCRALNGEPGVYSSRYAGEDATYADNNKLLLNRLKDVPKEKEGLLKPLLSVFEDE